MSRRENVEGHRRESAACRSSRTSTLGVLLAVLCGVSEFQGAVRSCGPRLGARILAWGIAACLLVAVSLFGVKSLFRKSEPNVVKRGAQTGPGQVAVTDRTIDLFNHGTTRGGGDPSPLDAVSLPSTLVHLHLILPRFSDPGSYVVAVSKDRAGTAIVARGTGKTVADGPRLFVDVLLDLRYAEAGSYFLATVRESDNGTYYYPVNVQEQ